MNVNVAAAKRTVKSALASSVGWKLFNRTLRRPGVSVLMYHRIRDHDASLGGLPLEVFTAHMEWLRERCDPIWPEELPERLRETRPRKPAVLVTFDDGFRDYHDRAYPVLRRLQIPATVFLATQFMDRGGEGIMWTEELQWAAVSTQKKSVTLPWDTQKTLELPDREARARLGEIAREHLKSLPDDERRTTLDALLRELGGAPNRGREMLNWDEVRATMQWTRYGGHTHTHPILSRLPRPEAEREIATCRERIKAETGHDPKTFAYPNGRASDYTAETQAILKEQGFTLAFTTVEGVALPNTDWLAIKRLPAYADNIPDFAYATAGLERV